MAPDTPDRRLAPEPRGGGPRRLPANGQVLTVLTCVAVLLSLLAGGCAEAPAEPPPHIVLVVCDTLRADHLDLYGYERNTAPKLSAWARDALVFERATAPCNWTRPSMLSLFSGRHPDADLVLGRNDVFPTDVPSLAELLREAGYETVAITANPYMVPMLEADRGFDSFTPLGFQSDQLTGHQGTRIASPFVMDRVDYLLSSRRPGDKPLFLYVHFMDSHMPYDPPDEFRTWVASDYDGPASWTVADYRVLRGPQVDEELQPDDRDHVIALYDGEILQLDESMARLRRMVDEYLGDRRVVSIVTSDHGEAFGEGRDNHYLHGHGLGPELTQVPLVIGGLGRSGRLDTRVGLVDLLPTLAELARAPVPDDIDGVSLIEPRPGRSYVTYRALKPADEQPLEALPDNVQHRAVGELGIVRDGARLERIDGTWHLFDLATGEDLSERFPERVEALRAEAERWYDTSRRRRAGAAATDVIPLSPEYERTLEALGYTGR